MDGLEEELGRLGARVAPQWLAACVDFLQGSQPGLAGAPAPVRAKAVLQQLLAADLNQCGAPALPPGVQALHDTVLPGKLLLQVDEVVNIAAAVRERYSGNDGGHRCLKLLLTDGVQQVAAVEYRSTPALHSAMPAGCKLVVQGAAVRRGMLLLTPQCCAVLGGGVPRLEDARRRMVAHWTQPAVGRRGPTPTMAQATAEATRAAWAGGPAPGAAGGRPPQQQMLQGPAANPQQQQQPVAARPAPHQQQGLVAQRPSQQATQLVSQPPQQQQQQQQQPAAQQGVGPASGRLQPAPPGQPQQQQQQQRRPEVQRQPLPQQQQQQQHYPPQNFGGGGVTGRAAGAGAATGPAAPLHDHNGGAKHNRLAQSKPSMQAAPGPAAADFGFAQPPQQQPGARPGGPARAQPAAANPLAQRLRQATGAAAAAGGVAAAAGGGMQGAGTDDDPICLDGAEEQQAQPGSEAGAAAEGDVAMAAADEQDGWDGDEGWDDEEAALAGPNLDPWEQGYGAAEDEEQLPDAEQPNDDSWQAGEGWGAGEGWQDDSGDAVAMEEDAAAGGLQDQLDAAAAGDEEGSWDDEVDAAQGAAPQSAPPAAAAAAAVRQQAAAQAATGALPSGKRRSSGSAVEVPRPSSRQQQQQQAPQHGGLDGSLQFSRPPKQQLLQRSPVQPAQKHRQVQAAAVTPVGGASTISSTLGLADLTVQPPSDFTHRVPRVPPAAAAPEQPAQQPGEQQQQPASPHALGPLAVPELEALSPSLLGAAPTLAEVLYSKPVAALEAAAPAPAAAAVASGGRGSGGSGRAVPSVPALRGAPQRPAPSSGRGQLRLLSVSAPPGAAARPAAASKPQPAAAAAAAAPAAPAISDDDMPSFALLDDMSPTRPQLGAAAVSQDEPFTYLLRLHRRAASADADPASFPLSARIFGTIRGINGKLGFTNPLTGQPEYTMSLEIEDGSLLVPARLGSQFMHEFFDVEPGEFQALLADPARKLEGVELAKGLQKLLSSYSGLIEVELEAPGRPLLVRNIGQELREDEVVVLQRRAAGG